MTYVVGTDIWRVRLQTGDKNLADIIFTDDEINEFLSVGGTINLASAMLLEAWAAMYGVSADTEKIGDYSYGQKIVDKMLALAKRLRDADGAIPVLEWAEIDLTAGSAITAEED